MDLGFDEPLEKQDSPRVDFEFDKPLEIHRGSPRADLGFDKPLVMQDSPRADLGFDEPLEMRDSPRVDLGFDEPLEKQDLPRQTLSLMSLWISVEASQGQNLGLTSLW